MCVYDCAFAIHVAMHIARYGKVPSPTMYTWFKLMSYNFECAHYMYFHWYMMDILNLDMG